MNYNKMKKNRVVTHFQPHFRSDVTKLSGWFSRRHLYSPDVVPLAISAARGGLTNEAGKMKG